MLKFLALAATAIVVLVAAVLIYAATRPDTFRVERAADIQAPPAEIFAILSDFRRSAEWSPYEQRDPDMRRTYSGAPSGKGAIYEWDGDPNVGAGRIEITDSAPPDKLMLRLDMTRPMMVNNVVEYTLEPNGSATRVTWAMHGPVPFPAKVMHVFVDVDRMVGQDFEQGLANLKAVAEK
jgi:uncharacterized protein YndB with AHSA1/START domain